MLGLDGRVPPGRRRACTSTSSSAPTTSAGSSAPSTSTATASTASTTSMLPTDDRVRRPRRRARPGRPLPLPADRRRLLRRRSAVLDLAPRSSCVPAAARCTTALRLGAFVARCQMSNDHDELDDVAARWTGCAAVRPASSERLWRPLLDSKFDGRFDDLPATYIWARTRRMSGTRDAGGREMMGRLEGGYQTLDRRARRRSASSAARSTPARRSTRSRPTGPRDRASSSTAGRAVRLGALHAAAAARSRASWRRELAPRSADDHCRYLGVICVIVRDARERQPVLHAQHHRPAGSADDGRRDDARRRSGVRRRPPGVRHEVRRSVAPRPATRRSRRGRARLPRPRAGDLPGARRRATSSARRAARAGAVEPVHLVGGARRLPDDVPGSRARAGVDRARVSRGRQRPGGDRRRRPAAAGILARLRARGVPHDDRVRRPMCIVVPLRHASTRAADRAPRPAAQPTSARSRARCSSPPSCSRHVGHLGQPRPGHRLRRGGGRAGRPRPVPYVDFLYYYGPLAPALAAVAVSAAARASARRSHSASS